MNFKKMEKNRRLENFDVKHAIRKTEVKNGTYTPDCGVCYDLDFYLDYFTQEPTLCIPCCKRNMDDLQAKIKQELEGYEIL